MSEKFTIVVQELKNGRVHMRSYPSVGEIGQRIKKERRQPTAPERYVVEAMVVLTEISKRHDKFEKGPQIVKPDSGLFLPPGSSL